jgi:hypothetical protein
MQPLRDTATNVLRDLLSTQPDTAAKVEFAWRLAAGAAMARATSIAWTDGKLIVRARDAQWRREVRRARPTIAARLNRTLGPGVVTAIHVEED